jgi:hypothetical protein
MSSLSRTTLAAMLLALAPLPHRAVMASEPLACPPEIPGRSMQLTDTPAGWKFYAESSLYLHSAAPMTGPPERLGHLIEDNVRQQKKQEIYTYKLDGPFPEGKWMQCSYGTSGEVSLSKRLDDNIEACTITYRKGEKAGQNHILIACK